jgi:hypothetical protein
MFNTYLGRPASADAGRRGEIYLSETAFADETIEMIGATGFRAVDARAANVRRAFGIDADCVRVLTVVARQVGMPEFASNPTRPQIPDQCCD